MSYNLKAPPSSVFQEVSESLCSVELGVPMQAAPRWYQECQERFFRELSTHPWPSHVLQGVQLVFHKTLEAVRSSLKVTDVACQTEDPQETSPNEQYSTDPMNFLQIKEEVVDDGEADEEAEAGGGEEEAEAGGSETEKKAEVKSEEQKAPCEDCGKMIGVSKRAQKRHMRYKHGPKEACEVCGRELPVGLPLELHRKSHQRKTEEENSTQCPDCHRVYPTPKRMKIHRETIHGGPEVVCPICHMLLRSGPREREHMKMHERYPDGKCPHCDYHHKNPSSVYNHERIEHPQETVMCNVCGERFHKSKMRNHMEVVHSDKGSRDYRCLECNKIFKTQGTWRQHKMVFHSNRPLLLCTICGDEFRTQRALRSHTMRRHEEPKLSCPQCGKRYHAEKNLRQHMDVHSDTRRFPCPDCPKAFFNQKYLKAHMNTHSGLRPYACPYCPDTFAGSGARHNHVKLRHKKFSLVQ